MNGQKNLLISEPGNLATYAGLALGTTVKIKSGEDAYCISVRSAKYNGKSWVLPIIEPPFVVKDYKKIKGIWEDLRKKYKFEAL